VLPDGFDFASTFTPGMRVEMLVPARLEEMREWGNTLAVIGRLKPAVTIDQARAEFTTLVPPIARALDYTFGTDMRPLKQHVSGSMRRALIVLWAAVGLVLLIVCANLSNLLLARTASRSKEFAMRLALGSSRGRIVTQLIVEGLVLAACGALLGIPLAYVLTGALTASATLAVPLMHQVRVDAAALGITALTAIVSGVAVGIIPALRVAARPPQDALKAQGRGTTDGRHHARVRSTLVIVEVALASVLLVGAGLLLRSFMHILDVDLGFRPAQATALKLEVFSQLEPEARRARLFAAARRAAAVPGVEAVGLTDALPLDRNRTWGVGVPGHVYPEGQSPSAFVYVTGPGYFQAMGIELIKGRDFTEHDTADGASVGIINASLARQLFATLDPIGQTAQTGDNKFTVVGVVADVRQSSLDEAAASQMYMPFTRGGGVSSDLIVRSTLPPAALVPAVRAALAEVDRSVSIVEVRPLTDLVDRAVSPRRFLLSLLAGFAVVGLLLASVGIYGVVSYGVAQRVQEIGVRMALGATARSVRALVLWETLRLSATGIAIGLLASTVLARMIAALLYDTSPADPIAFVATGALLVTVAALAGYVPARRASRLDPMTALRAD
jgi:predicted permease